MVARQIPRPADLKPLLRFKAPRLDRKAARLADALTIDDLRRIARRRTPTAVFDYTEGAAESEISIARARQAFEDIEFHPNVLRDVAEVTTDRQVLGGAVALPFGIAPTGFTRMMQTEGEVAGARVAGMYGIPFSLSTMGTTSIEDVRAANPHGRNWFQLYLWKDRDRSMALVDRAAKAGFDTLLVTVDVPVAGARLRDKRNGFSIPPALSARTVLDALPRPWWWWNSLTTGAAGVRVARPMVGDGRGADRHDVRRDRRPPGPGLHQGPVAGKGCRKASRTSTTHAASPTSVSTASSVNEEGDTRPSPDRSTCCPTSSARWARSTRSSSTPASGPAPTSSPPSPWARATRSSVAPISTA